MSHVNIDYMHPFMIRSWPRSILHFDADSFFASVEQALDPSLKGKPIVTGAERGIVSAASYEAKAMGIPRGMPIYKVRELYPEVIIRSSDYITYSLFSSRIFHILHTHFPCVEESSIDEGYAELTGLRRVYKAPYKEITRRIKEEVESSLGITVSFGVGVTKTLAKIASKFRKPSGLTAVPGKYTHILLSRTPLEKVPGFGPNTCAYLHQYKLFTALDFALKNKSWASQHLGKIGRDLWHELRGDPVFELTPHDEVHTQQSMSQIKTFSPPTSDYNTLLTHCVKNTEDVCMKLRHIRMTASHISVLLKTQQFRYLDAKISLTRSSNLTQDFIPVVETLLKTIHSPSVLIRATCISLHNLEEDKGEQRTLFDDHTYRDKLKKLAHTQDNINERFGRGSLHLASTLPLRKKRGKELVLPFANFTLS